MIRVTTLVLALCLSAPALAAPPAPPATPGTPSAAPHAPQPPGHRRGEQVREREAEMMDFLAEGHPEAFERMSRLRDQSITADDRAAYLYRLSQTVKRLRAEAEDPERFERRRLMRDMEREVRQLAEGADALPKSEQKARQAQLETLVAELFDLRQEERRVRLVEAEARLEALRAEIDERDADREKIIDEFVDGLMNPMPEL